MNAFGSGLFRTADHVSLSFQHAVKIFGFRADGRDLVVMADAEGIRTATFPDHSDEGWPEVSVGLPADVRFSYAADGWLTRVARWQVKAGESEVLEELSLNTDAPRFKSRAAGGFVATLGLNAILKVKGVSAALTLVSFEQCREPEAWERGMRSRAER